MIRIFNVLNFSQFIDGHKTKHLKEKSGAPFEYADEGDVSFDIYKDTWPLAPHMMWYIPAAVREADSVSIGDGESQSNSTKADDLLYETFEFEDDGSLATSSCSFTPARTQKSRSRSDNFESTFQTVASSITSFLEKSEKKSQQSDSSQPVEKKLKYNQMYEELDKVLENVNFLDAVKFLTGTIEAASSKFASN